MPKVALLGFGAWGRNFARNFNNLGVLGGICDVDPKARQLAAKFFPGVPVYATIEEVLSATENSALVIATPAATHYRLALQALEAGRDVLVEKPLALEVWEAESLVELANKRDRVLMVGHILRYHPAVRKLKSLIQDGELGKIYYIYSNRLNIGRIRSEENILWSFAPHDLSAILFLLDEEPESVSCQGGAYLSRGVPDVTTSEFLFPSGVRAHIFVSWLHPFKEQRLVVIGTRKMAVLDDTVDEKLVVYPHRVEWRNRIPTAVRARGEKVPVEGREPLQLECEHFLECVRTRRKPLTDGEEGLRVLRVLSWCQESLRKGEAESEHVRRRPPEGAAMGRGVRIHETAVVEEGSEIGEGTVIWHFTHIEGGAKVGRWCTLGQNCNVARGAVIGDRVKIQNNVSVYAGVVVEDDVFLGPSCVFTNVTNPRAEVSRRGLYERTVVRRGATIGANATIVCGVEIGRYAFVGAGAVVTSNVPDYALVVGNPARQVGWVSRHGHRLANPDSRGVMVCPESGLRYRLDEAGRMRCLDLDEGEPLPEALRKGRGRYTDFHKVEKGMEGTRGGEGDGGMKGR